MAICKNKDYVFETMRSKNICFWSVKDTDEINSFEGTDIDESIIALNNLLQAYTNSGVLTIILYKKSKSELGEGGNIKNAKFTIKFDTSINSIPTPQPTTNYHDNKFDILTNQIAALTEKIEGIGEMEEEEEEEPEETPSKVIIDSLKPHIPALTGLLLSKLGLSPTPTPINGIDNVSNDILDIVNELETIDTNINYRLKKLVYLAKNDINTYTLAVNFLNNLVSDEKIK